jgi:hypothetical protein
MAGFLFRLETTDGAAADPSTLESAVPNWKAGESIYLGSTSRSRDPRRRCRPATRVDRRGRGGMSH